ncbi:tyrosine-type recombinase/integrase [Ornithinicoccus halotolerans]|uniref:tyrosine-type recombinase/integrase n=1 Tax=Ornithinicoccus halotolerans TaxID=1748220 RepID=UPI001294B87F
MDWGRQWGQGSFYRRNFRPALDRAELGDVWFHDLRHTWASMLLADGVEPYKVSRWMGHTSITTTNTIYSHLDPSDHSVETARMQAYLSVSSAPGSSSSISTPSGVTVTPASA